MDFITKKELGEEDNSDNQNGSFCGHKRGSILENDVFRSYCFSDVRLSLTEAKSFLQKKTKVSGREYLERRALLLCVHRIGQSSFSCEDYRGTFFDFQSA